MSERYFIVKVARIGFRYLTDTLFVFGPTQFDDLPAVGSADALFEFIHKLKHSPRFVG